MSNFIKIRKVGAGLLHVDRETDERTEGWRDNQKDRSDKASSRLSQLCTHAT